MQHLSISWQLFGCCSITCKNRFGAHNKWENLVKLKTVRRSATITTRAQMSARATPSAPSAPAIKKLSRR